MYVFVSLDRSGPGFIPSEDHDPTIVYYGPMEKQYYLREERRRAAKAKKNEKNKARKKNPEKVKNAPAKT